MVNVQFLQNLPVTCVALVNDTVGCLMSCAFVDKETALGVIIGKHLNFFNMCFKVLIDNYILFSFDF